MGANNFETYGWGVTAKKAFADAVEQAAWECGHGGYTGTIAEKSSFIMIPITKGKSPIETARDLIEHSDCRIDDKWGDAGCIEVTEEFFDEDDKSNKLKHKNEKLYLFFGWASS